MERRASSIRRFLKALPIRVNSCFWFHGRTHSLRVRGSRRYLPDTNYVIARSGSSATTECRIAGKRRNFIRRLTGSDVPTIKNSEASSDTEGLKMPTIDENRIFTAIIEWEVPPERQQALI